jgi:hypothetical protein
VSVVVQFDEAAGVLGATPALVQYRTFTARCPAHADRGQSLTVTEVADGRLIATCGAGCAFVDVIRAVRRLRRGGR